MYMYMCKYTYKCVLDFFMVHTLVNVFGCCVGDIWLQNVVPQPRNIVWQSCERKRCFLRFAAFPLRSHAGGPDSISKIPYLIILHDLKRLNEPQDRKRIKLRIIKFSIALQSIELANEPSVGVTFVSIFKHLIYLLFSCQLCNNCSESKRTSDRFISTCYQSHILKNRVTKDFTCIMILNVWTQWVLVYQVKLNGNII